jgi:hypothetical protein
MPQTILEAFAPPHFDPSPLREVSAIAAPTDRGADVYAAGLAAERRHDVEAARRSYESVIATMPDSPFVVAAYVGIGEILFAQSGADPSKLTRAETSYQTAVLVHSSTPLVGYAWYMQALIAARTNDYALALESCAKALDDTALWASAPAASAILAAARNEIVALYALASDGGDLRRSPYDPRSAYAYFVKWTHESRESNATTLSLMRDLGELLLRSGHYMGAIGLYQDLDARDSPGSCAYEAHIREAACALGGASLEAYERTCADVPSRYESVLLLRIREGTASATQRAALRDLCASDRDVGFQAHCARLFPR